MKYIVLGIMIASVSMSFAQNDDAPTHQLKNRFSAKHMMAVKPAAGDVKDNAEKVGESESAKSNIVQGVIRIERGTAYIVVKDGQKGERRFIPLNMPKRMEIDGEKIQFSYLEMDVDSKSAKKSNSGTMVNIYDVTVPQRKPQQ